MGSAIHADQASVAQAVAQFNPRVEQPFRLQPSVLKVHCCAAVGPLTALASLRGPACLVAVCPFSKVWWQDNCIRTRSSSVAAVACCCCQDILAAGSTATDASGNAILADVGTWLRDEFKKHFKVGRS
jgi:hypothetical protein